MTIQRLPSELFGRIAELLSRGDLHQCILVNRTLNTAMTPFLYRTISVTTAANVFHSLSKLNGAFVRQLVAEDDVLSPEDIQTLCSLCPNLTELEYVWPNKDTVHTPGSRSFFPRSPPLLLRHIVDPKRLVSLQLCYHEARYCAEDISIDIVCQFFFSLLRHLPSRLHSLSLVGLLPILQVTHLEAIHMACPSLTHLTIEGSNMVLTPKSHNTACHPHLKSLRIAYPSGWSQASQWIYFIFTHYPNIEVLELVNTSSVRNVFRPLLADARLTDGLAYPQRLFKLKFLKLGPYNPECMMPLTYLRALAEVDIQSDCDWDVIPWLEAICDRLRRLSFNFPRINKDKVLQTLGKFRHLEELGLIITSTLSLSNFFLWGCPPSLRRLTLCQGYISYDTDHSSTSASSVSKIIPSAGITHLALHNASIVAPDVLETVVARCPLLSTIETFCCVWILSSIVDKEQQHKLQFNFTQRQLDFFSMTSSSIADPQEMEPYGIQLYKFHLSSPTTDEASMANAFIERTGCKRIRDAQGDRQAPLFVTFENSTHEEVHRVQKTRRRTGMHTYTVVESPKETPWCIVIRCKSIKKICIDGHQL